jgi:hypothetical protein
VPFKVNLQRYIEGEVDTLAEEEAAFEAGAVQP